MAEKLTPFTVNTHLWHYLDTLAFADVMLEGELQKVKEELHDTIQRSDNEFCTFKLKIQDIIKNKNEKLYDLEMKIKDITECKNKEIYKLKSTFKLKTQDIIKNKNEKLYALEMKIKDITECNNKEIYKLKSTLYEVEQKKNEVILKLQNQLCNSLQNHDGNYSNLSVNKTHENIKNEHDKRGRKWVPIDNF